MPESNVPPNQRRKWRNRQTGLEPLHHKHNAADYPHKADEPGNIVPATKGEHLNKWHGGNFQNDTAGEPLNPEYEDEF